MKKVDTHELKPPSHRRQSRENMLKPEQPTKSPATPKGEELIGMNDEYNQNPTILAPEDSEDFLRCTLYVRLHELQESHTKKAIAADFFKVDYKTLIAWIVRWQASGLLQRVRSMMFTALVADDIRAAGDMVAREWAAIVRRQVLIAKSSKSDFAATESARWLHEIFIGPRMADEEGDLNQELAYIMGLREANYSTDPMALLTEGETTEVDESQVDEFEFDIPDELGKPAKGKPKP